MSWTIFFILMKLSSTIFHCSCADKKTQKVLKLVCDLYALDRIWYDIGTYRNVDYVAPNKAKVTSSLALVGTGHSCDFALRLYLYGIFIQAIHKLTEYLSFQVRGVARELVDAFDLPDLVTRAPIGMPSEAYANYTQYIGF